MVRRFEFAVDRGHAKAVNETIADVRRLRMAAIVLAVVLGAATAVLISLDHPWSYILSVVFAIGAATSLWVAIWAPRRVGSIEKLYAEGPLVAAVVSETRSDGLTLLALVDVGLPDAAGARYAFVTRSVRSLPGHNATPGERVPSVSVLADRTVLPTGDTWQQVRPMPIAWGTRDGEVIARAIAAIDDAEWQLLADNLSVSEKVRRAENNHLLVNPKDLPPELR
ncbi:DUF3239 domain-containing protein [Antrihabitans sp. NCIMB 15449]|uniref:DUF3239 domain-containing protein n=1 Tax=Antrihabitans spumae TaxID=3373370 RepID=A0ABW7JYC8_9NOCA